MGECNVRFLRNRQRPRNGTKPDCRRRREESASFEWTANERWAKEQAASSPQKEEREKKVCWPSAQIALGHAAGRDVPRSGRSLDLHFGSGADHVSGRFTRGCTLERSRNNARLLDRKRGGRS